MIKRFRELNISLVHAHFGTSATRIWPSIKSAGLPLIVTLHGNDITVDRAWWEAGLGGLRGRVYPRRLLRMARDPNVSFIAVSEAIRKSAIEYGVPAEKITVSYIGVNTDRMKPGPMPMSARRKRILFVGRMVEKKAPMLMVRAFVGVCKRVDNAELVMIGSGPLLAEAKGLAVELGVPITFLGACTHEKVLEQLHEARVFCLPSIKASNGDKEGLPISILEALACGVPVVTSASGAVNEVIHPNISGLPVMENDLDGLQGALVELLCESNEMLSIIARQYCIDHFNLNAHARHLETLYDQQ